MNIQKSDLQEAHQRIQPYIHLTPLITSKTLTSMANCNKLYLKCENFQKIGAFKIRGAINKLLQLPKTVKHVCCHSSGNHAQALAFASKILGIRATIVMPENSPLVKVNAVKGYGAEIVTSGNTVEQRDSKCLQVSKKYNAQLIPPYNDRQIIIGQATCAKQIFQQSINFDFDFDYIVFPIGGGGLASGTLLSTNFYGKKCKPIGVQPYLARDAYLSVEKGSIQPQFPPITIADGLRTNLGDKTYALISQHLTLNDIILVSESQIIQAMKIVIERMKIVIQPSSATVIAAVLKDSRFIGKNVCCIISGGNVDMNVLYKHLQDKAKL